MSNKPTITKPKGRYRLQYRGTECLNCGHPLDISDKYCPNCSQANSTKKLTLKDFFDEFFSSLISYDSRLLKTLSALLWRPGKITREYVEGRRASYTNPFRFLLSLAIIYFLMMNFSGDFEKFDEIANNKVSGASKFKDGIFNLSFVNNEEMKEANAVLDSLDLPKTIEKAINDKDSTILSNPKKYYAEIQKKSGFGRFSAKHDFFQTLIKSDSANIYDIAKAKYSLEDSFENKYAFNAAKSTLKVTKQPGSFVSAIISRLPFLIFFFLPVFSLFIWLVYVRKKYNYTDHLIFSFHNQSLLFILLIISFLIDAIFDISTNGFALLIFAVYLFIALKRFYAQGWFKTIVKYTFLNTIFFILAMLSIVVLSVGSAFTY